MLKKSFGILCLLLLMIPYAAQNDQTKQQAVSEYEKRLNRISAQIENLRSKIADEKKRESSILSRLGNLGIQKTLIRKEIAMYDTQQEKAATELNSIQRRIPRLQSQLENNKEAVSKVLVTLYKFGRLNHLELLMQNADIGSLLSEYKHLTLLAQHQDKIISQHITTLRELDSSQQELEAKKSEIETAISNARAKQQDLRNEERKYQSLKQEITQNQETHLQAIEELRDRAEQLQNLIKDLLENKSTLPFPLVPMDEQKGRLAWPIPCNRIVARFGNIRHPRFKTITKNNGIEIDPGENIIVRNIHPGMVVFADYFEGYGNLIIIDHGMSYHTLYGHCSEFLVKKGDPVQAQQPIAYVGDVGSLQGKTLYFEIRQRTKAVNPLQWLKRR